MGSIEDKAGGALTKSESGARKDESVRESREEQRVLQKTETCHTVGPRLEAGPWSYQKNFKSDCEG